MPTKLQSTTSLPISDSMFAVFAGFLGWTLDAFDFFLVVIALPRIARDFHVAETAIAFSLTLTLLFRPVGALIFGLLADRYGRRIPMMLDLIFYSAVEVATAFAPNLGVFLVLRALFGIGMGGEWGIGASLVMEKVPAKRRGALSGILQEGYAFGYLLSAVAAYFLLDRFGWRRMFLLGGIPALLAVFVRFSISESDVWQKTRAASWRELIGTIGSHWKLWMYLSLLMATMGLSAHATQDMYPTFMKSFRHLDPKVYSQIVMVMMVGAILGGMAFGLASDRLGRRRMMVLSFTGALIALPLWAYSTTFAAIVAGAFLMQFMVQGAWGIVPAHISELSPDTVRGFLPGVALGCGNLLAASIAYLQARLAVRYPYPHIMAITSGISLVGAIVVISLGQERRGMEFGNVAAPGSIHTS